MQFVFGQYRLDPRRRELLREGERLHVEPQVFDLILHLLRNRERVVSQDELLEALWHGRVVSDSTFRSRVNAARSAIGDSGKRQRFIRTVPRRGLRFVGEIVEQQDTDASAVGKEGTRARDGATLGLAPGENSSRPTVAVLPLSNLSGDAAWEHFADAIAEDIITLLSKHRSLLVIARNSAFVFKNQLGDLRRVGRALDAQYIVEGSLHKVAQALRIGIHLVEAETGRLLSADRYDSTLDSLFDVQDVITTKIASSIEPQIGSAERTRVENRHPQNFCAWDLFHLGVRHLYRATPDDNRAAQRLLRQALEHDSSLAQAYALLSYAITLSMLYFDAEPDERRLRQALDLARRGLELDDQDALIRFVHGRALLALRDYTGALAELRQSIDVNPALAVGYCGVGDSLAYEGRFEEAFSYFQKAIDLSPHDPQRWAFQAYRALAHLFAGQFEDALDWAQRSVRVPHCHHWPFAHRVSALGHLGRRSEARAAIDELMERRPGFTCGRARERLFYVKDSRHLEGYLQGLREAGVPE